MNLKEIRKQIEAREKSNGTLGDYQLAWEIYQDRVRRALAAVRAGPIVHPAIIERVVLHELKNGPCEDLQEFSRRCLESEIAYRDGLNHEP